jgi:hypothetical protein
MKKTFPMEVPGIKPPRVVESIKHDVRKYLKRERRKALPEGVDFWDFDCRVGPDAGASKSTHPDDINGVIDTASREHWAAIYIEILAKQGHRQAKPGKPVV